MDITSSPETVEEDINKNRLRDIGIERGREKE